MFNEGNNLKDTTPNSVKDSSSVSVSYTQNTLIIGSYSKTDKLITALYMVTDILPETEPIRAKLRSLALEILSDIYVVSKKPALVFEVDAKVNEVVSLLSLSRDVGIISEMNASILQKEFFELKKALNEYSDSSSKWLAGFLVSKKAETALQEENQNEGNSKNSTKSNQANTPNSKTNFFNSTGSNSKRQISSFPSQNQEGKNIKDSTNTIKDIKAEKHKRQEEILRIVRENNIGLTISDIRSKGTALITSCAEKTLQRELISMVKDNVLKKEGEKRWSKYFLA